MKKTLVAMLLALGAIASAQQPAAQPGAQPAAAQPGSPAHPQKKEIKDPAEYNAYVGAVQQKDPSAKISGLEAFLTQYPNSVMKSDALELLMSTYQQNSNPTKMMDAANRLLQVDPKNVKALALLAYTERTRAQGGDPNPQLLTQANQHGQQGLQALPSFTKPDGMSDADFDKQKTQLAGIFNAAIGIYALQNKDYATASKSLRAAVDVNATDFSLVYPLALAYLQATPPDSINGIWYAARAAAVGPNPQIQQQIERYAKSQYAKYHGAEDGWTDVFAQAKASPTMPAGFSIKPAPTPSEQAAALVNGKTPDDIKKLSFAEWELVLSAGDQPAQDTVWNVIKGVPLQMEGTVMKVSPTELQIAASSDDIEQKRADIVLTMVKAIPASLMPKEGQTLDFEGTPVSYTPSPFVMTMENGTLLKAAAPARKPPVRRKPAAKR